MNELSWFASPMYDRNSLIFFWGREVPDGLEFEWVRFNSLVADYMPSEFNFIPDLQFLARDRDVVAFAPFQHDIYT